MANKACEGNCYPHMMKAGDWNDINRDKYRKEMLHKFFPKQNDYIED